MLKLISMLWMTLYLSLISAAQSNKVLKEKIQKIHQSFFDGILAEDYKSIDQLLAKDVSLGFPHGGFSPKEGYITALKNGNLYYDSSSHELSNIRIYDNTAVVNGKSSLVFRYKDENDQWFKMLEHLSYTTVYVINKNTVKMVAWQSNRLPTDVTIKVPE